MLFEPTAPASAQQAPAAAATAEASTVDVLRFEVDGNTLLKSDVIEQRLAGFRGALSLARLREAAAAVQELYRVAGYGGVVAYLPQQDPQAGVVRIRVVEGRLTRIDVEEGKDFKRANLLASVPTLQLGRTPDVRRIDAEIQIANENPAKNLQVLLQPGAEPGSIAAKVSVVEQPVQRLTARADNTGNGQNGRWRTAFGWQDANAFDRDHVFAAEWQTAPSNVPAVNVVSGSYRAPLYGRAMALDAFGAWSDVSAGKVATQAGDLAFAGKGTVAGARLNIYLPRLGNLDQRLVAGAEWREYLNSCAIDGLPAGACGAAGASVAVQPLSLTYTVQAAGELRYGLSVGLHVNAATGGRNGTAEAFEAVRAGSERHYAALRVSGQVALPVEGWGQVSARASSQYTARPLVPGELFGVGGSASVRGYEERELSGDSGVQLTLEAQSLNFGEGSPAWRGADLRAVAFADAGYVNNHQGYACLGASTSCRIGSLGAGLRGGWQQVQLRADAALAMANGSSTRKYGGRLHVALSYNY